MSNQPERITMEMVKGWIEMGDDEFEIEKFRAAHGISPESANFYMCIKRLVEQKYIKRVARGIYRKIILVNSVKWWVATPEDVIDFTFPQSHIDFSSFGIEDMVNIERGDLILISGVSNAGKTCFAMNLLAENLGKMPAYLMGSEYTSADRKPTAKFQRRIRNMEWAEWMCGEIPMFELYPVGDDYEDYVVKDGLNIIDWISLEDRYYLIDTITKKIKDRVGKGVVVVVIQKNKGNEFGEGGERSTRYADLELKIDPYGEEEGMLTIGKVKSPKAKATGRRFAFKIVEAGSNFTNIRELKVCQTCYGRGTYGGHPCDTCLGLRYLDK